MIIFFFELRPKFISKTNFSQTARIDSSAEQTCQISSNASSLVLPSFNLLTRKIKNSEINRLYLVFIFLVPLSKALKDKSNSGLIDYFQSKLTPLPASNLNLR